MKEPRDQQKATRAGGVARGLLAAGQASLASMQDADSRPRQLNNERAGGSELAFGEFQSVPGTNNRGNQVAGLQQ